MGLVEYHLDSTQIIEPSVAAEGRDTMSGLVDEHHDVFQGIGRVKGVKVKLYVDPDAKGVVQKQRRISILLKDKFDELLNKWEGMDMIVWCSNVVLTPKEG